MQIHHCHTVSKIDGILENNVILWIWMSYSHNSGTLWKVLLNFLVSTLNSENCKYFNIKLWCCILKQRILYLLCMNNWRQVKYSEIIPSQTYNFPAKWVYVFLRQKIQYYFVLVLLFSYYRNIQRNVKNIHIYMYITI